MTNYRTGGCSILAAHTRTIAYVSDLSCNCAAGRQGMEQGGLLHVESLGLGHAEQLLYQPPGLVPADAYQRLFRRAYVVRGEQVHSTGGQSGGALPGDSAACTQQASRGMSSPSSLQALRGGRRRTLEKRSFMRAVRRLRP